MRQCRQCGSYIHSGATACPACGQRLPGGWMPWAAGAVLLAFAAAMAVAGLQLRGSGEEKARSALPAELQVVERSGVGLFGVDMAVVIPDTLVTDPGMTWAAEEIRGFTDGRGFVRARFYTDAEAARLAETGLEGELGDRQPWFDHHHVGFYRRNDRVTLEELAWAPGGLERGPVQVVEW